jgi:apolipoprotein D and lipocalin family protein
MNLRSESPRVGALAVLTLFATLCGCQSRPNLAVERYVDIPRFMGGWYVIACIPTRIERSAYAPEESYSLDARGRVRTEFTFHDGSFDGPLKRYTPIGYVRPGSGGAVWGMQFIWPIKADYRIMYVDPAYTMTLIGREKRDHAWIMARAPRIEEAEFQRLRTLLAAQGYDVGALRRMPQSQSP